jgi:hypothetical protein
MTVAKRAGKENPMECGVHLPLLAFRGQAFSLSRLVDYAQTAEQLGFTTLCADDHLTFSRPWLDSIAALASVLTNLAKYRRIVYREYRKDRTMNTHMYTKQRLEGAVNTEMIVPEKDKLVASGFTTEEIVSLFWLRQWYQTVGSDRVPIVRHLEFLNLLVLNGKLEA